VGISQVSDLIAVTDGGNGLEEALQSDDDSGLVPRRRTHLRLRERKTHTHYRLFA